MPLIFGFLARIGLGMWFKIGMIAVVMSTMGGLYLKGRMDCKAKFEVSKLEKENEMLRQSFKLLRADLERAKVDQAELEELEREIEDVKTSIVNPDHRCFTDVESERLRGLFE